METFQFDHFSFFMNFLSREYCLKVINPNAQNNWFVLKRLLTYVRTSTTNWLLMINDRAITWNSHLLPTQKKHAGSFFECLQKRVFSNFCSIRLRFSWLFTLDAFFHYILLLTNYVSLYHPTLCVLSSVRSALYV